MSVRRLDSTGEPMFGAGMALLPSGSEEVAVRLGMRLKLMKEEWFLDRTAGVGWLDRGAGEPRVFGASADLQLLESEVKRTVLETEGISTLLSYRQAFDHETRRATVEFTVTDIYDQIIPLTVVLP
jgi:hypothetical protein